jgi:hypothetical protein
MQYHFPENELHKNRNKQRKIIERKEKFPKAEKSY